MNAVRNSLLQFLEVQAKPRATGPSDPADSAVGEAPGQQLVNFGFFFWRDPLPVGVERELVRDLAAEGAPPAGVGMPIFTVWTPLHCGQMGSFTLRETPVIRRKPRYSNCI